MSEHNEDETIESVEPVGKRRMPDSLKKHLLNLQGKKYLPAAIRIVWFRDELGDEWAIRTQLIEGGHEAAFATVRAEILNPQDRIIATAHKTESKGDFPAGWVEKAEMGSVARALGFLGFGTQFNEDDTPGTQGGQGTRTYSQTPTGSPDRSITLNTGTTQCPACHAPPGKPHAKTCTA